MKILLMFVTDDTESKEYKECVEYIGNNTEEHSVLVAVCNDLHNSGAVFNGFGAKVTTDMFPFPINGYINTRKLSARKSESLNAMLKWEPHSEVEWYLLGDDTNFNVTATAFDLKDRGEPFRLLSNLIYTSNGDMDVAIQHLLSEHLV